MDIHHPSDSLVVWLIHHAAKSIAIPHAFSGAFLWVVDLLNCMLGFVLPQVVGFSCSCFNVHIAVDLCPLLSELHLQSVAMDVMRFSYISYEVLEHIRSV